MQFEGAVKIKAARKKVWAFLIDPHAVSQCAPGIDGLEIDRKSTRLNSSH